MASPDVKDFWTEGKHGSLAPWQQAKEQLIFLCLTEPWPRNISTLIRSCLSQTGMSSWLILQVLTEIVFQEDMSGGQIPVAHDMAKF